MLTRKAWFHREVSQRSFDKIKRYVLLSQPSNVHLYGLSSLCDRICPLRLNCLANERHKQNGNLRHADEAYRVNVLPHPGTGHSNRPSLVRLPLEAISVAGVVTLALGILLELPRPPSFTNLDPRPLLPLFPLASEPESWSEYVDRAGDTCGDCFGYGTVSLMGGRAYGEESRAREGLLLRDPLPVLARLPLREDDCGSGTSHCWLRI